MRLSLVEADALEKLLTLPRLIDLLDGVFVFDITIETSLEHELHNKLINKPGRVMNRNFLGSFREAINFTVDKYASSVSLYYMDADLLDDVVKTSQYVVDKLESLMGISLDT